MDSFRSFWVSFSFVIVLKVFLVKCGVRRFFRRGLGFIGVVLGVRELFIGGLNFVYGFRFVKYFFYRLGNG